MTTATENNVSGHIHDEEMEDLKRWASLFGAEAAEKVDELVRLGGDNACVACLSHAFLLNFYGNFLRGFSPEDRESFLDFADKSAEYALTVLTQDEVQQEGGSRA